MLVLAGVLTIGSVAAGLLAVSRWIGDILDTARSAALGDVERSNPEVLDSVD